MKRLSLLLVMAALSLAAQAPVKLFPACFAPDTMAVIRLDATQVMDQALFQEFLASKANEAGTFFDKVYKGTGVDLNTVKEAWIGLRGKNQMVIVLKGTFDADAIQAQVRNIETMQVVQRPGVPLAVILNNKNNPDKTNAAAVLNKETLVFGRPELVDAFLTALLGKGEGLPPERAAQANAMLESKAMVSALILNLPEKQVAKQPWLALFTCAEIQASLSGQDMVLDVALGLAKPEMQEPATKVLEGVRDLYGLLDENLRRLGPMQTMLLEGITVKPDDKRLVVELALPREVVEQFLRQRMGLPQ